jgi:ABC-2 type transport system permease protein
MNRNIFSKEMRLNSWNLILWGAVIIVLISSTMMLYPVFIENQSQIINVMKIVPEGALQFKGISDISGLLSILGFYAANNVIYMMLLGSIFSIVLSSTILLKEEYGKTAEYLVTRPVTRREIFLSKFTVTVIFILMLNIAASSAGFINLMIFKDDPFSIIAFLILSLYTFMLNFFFGSAGLFISMLVKRPRSITSLSIAIVVVLYFVDTISKITTDFSWVGFVSPFHYVDTAVTTTGYGADIFNLLFFGGFSLIFIFAALKIYERRDIYL